MCVHSHTHRHRYTHSKGHICILIENNASNQKNDQSKEEKTKIGIIYLEFCLHFILLCTSRVMSGCMKLQPHNMFLQEENTDRIESASESIPAIIVYQHDVLYSAEALLRCDCAAASVGLICCCCSGIHRRERSDSRVELYRSMQCLSGLFPTRPLDYTIRQN